MPSGVGAYGQADAAYGRELGSQPVVLLSRPVDSPLGFEPESVCNFLPKYPRTNQNDEEECSMEEGKKASRFTLWLNFSYSLFPPFTD
jgi:hypothetical protein